MRPRFVGLAGLAAFFAVVTAFELSICAVHAKSFSFYCAYRGVDRQNHAHIVFDAPTSFKPAACRAAKEACEIKRKLTHCRLYGVFRRA